MDFNHKIIQWNCRGLKPDCNEVSLLISKYNPSVFFFQETFLKPDDNISFKGFNIYNYVHTDCLRPSGRGKLIENFIKRMTYVLGMISLKLIILQVQSLLHLLIFPSVIQSLYLDYNWSVCEDQHKIDHFPIIIEQNKTLFPLRITFQSGN